MWLWRLEQSGKEGRKEGRKGVFQGYADEVSETPTRLPLRG